MTDALAHDGEPRHAAAMRGEIAINHILRR
jgi:hypothetical protein